MRDRRTRAHVNMERTQPTAAYPQPAMSATAPHPQSWRILDDGTNPKTSGWITRATRIAASSVASAMHTP
jgi:hypothetical protein